MNELKFELDFRTGAPIYEQIVEQVRSRIESGKLRPGDQLPTVRQLALELRVNFNTIARAYRHRFGPAPRDQTPGTDR